MTHPAHPSPLKLVVVYHELPHPVDHGGRLDVWRRLQALVSQGVEVHLVCWRNPALNEPDPGPDSPLRSVLRGVTVLEEKGKFAHPQQIFSLPGYARRRLLSPADWRRVQEALHGFRADGVLLEGPFAFGAARAIARHLSAPLVYRSHNIESRYARFILEKAQGWRARFNACLNVPGIDALEDGIFQEAKWYFDISPEDTQHWHRRGFTHGEWLPTVVDQAWADRVSAPSGWAPAYDVGYLGNLYQPNNVEGVTWFLSQVVPRLRARHPDMKVFVAGSRPVGAVRDAAAAANVDLLENPPEAEPVLRNARVLVNPVFAGSGVNTKCIEMLFTPAGLVATPIALKGLAPEAQRCFGVSEDPQEFAELIAERGQGASGQQTERDLARGCYDSRRVGRIIEVLRQLPSHAATQQAGARHATA